MCGCRCEEVMEVLHVGLHDPDPRKSNTIGTFT